MSFARVVRRAAAVGLGLILVWVAAILCLGLAYLTLPPVSTLMLGRWITGQAVTRTAVGLDDVSAALPVAAIVSEDARFCIHAGVDWSALREVVEDADEDGPSRGASTIPMQTAKNLFLWPGRSVVRKALELPVALFLDFIWSKRHMMEVYLNIAEWGDGIFGAEAAARHYFGKPARSLTRREAALLVTALPNPLRRNPSRPTARHRALAERLLARMETSAAVTDCLRR